MPERAFQCTPAAWNRDPILNGVSWEAEYLFRRLALECDRYWRIAVDGEDLAHSIRCTCFSPQQRFRAWSRSKVARCLDELAAAGIVRRLVQADRCWVEVGEWLRYAKGAPPPTEPERVAQPELALPATLFALPPANGPPHWNAASHSNVPPHSNAANAALRPKAETGCNVTLPHSNATPHSNAYTSTRDKDKTSTRVPVPDGGKCTRSASAARNEQELLDELAAILPCSEMLQNGGMWRQRIRHNWRGVAYAIEDWKLRTPDQRRAIKNVAAWLTDRHARALVELQKKTA
jgi:hypothetical protein